MAKEGIYLRVGPWGKNRTMSSSGSSFTKDTEQLLRTQRHQGGSRAGVQELMGRCRGTQTHQSVRKKSETSALEGSFLLKSRERLKGR